MEHHQLQFWSRLAAAVRPVGLLVVCLIAFASSMAQSATLLATYTVYPGIDLDFNSGGNLGSNGPFYFGLNVIGNPDQNTTVMKVDSTPASSAPHAVTYQLAASSPLPAGDFDPLALTWFATGIDSLSALLTGGQQYILRMSCANCSNVKNNLSLLATPLPAAFWLFGSALVGFVMLANKRSV